MIVIEDKGRLKFIDKDKELTIREGFKRLDELYSNEPQETRKIINRLKEKYWKV